MKNIITGAACLVLGIVIGTVIAPWRSDQPPSKAVTSNGPDHSPTRRLAQEIEVPIVDFLDCSVDEALDYLRVRSRKDGGANDSRAEDRLAFVLVDPNKVARHIDLKHQRVRMDKLCERIAELSGLALAFEEDAIVFRAKPAPAEAVPPNGP